MAGEYAAEALLTNGNADGCAGIDSFGAALQTVGRAHGDAANYVIADVLCDFRNDLLIAVLDLDSAQKLGQAVVCKTDIQNRANDLDNSSNIISHLASTPYE